MITVSFILIGVIMILAMIIAGAIGLYAGHELGFLKGVEAAATRAEAGTECHEAASDAYRAGFEDGRAAPVADGAVGYVSADGGVIWLTDGSFSLKPAAGANLFTRPQDASAGDAERAMGELKDCPFCGSAAERDPGWGGYVKCSDLQCPLGGPVDDETQWIAANVWNRRALSRSEVPAGWQPIETAPNDRIHVRGLWVRMRRGGRPDEMEWRQYVGYIEDETGRFVDPEYSEDFGWQADDYDRWMDLPAPPRPSRGAK